MSGRGRRRSGASREIGFAVAFAGMVTHSVLLSTLFRNEHLQGGRFFSDPAVGKIPTERLTHPTEAALGEYLIQTMIENEFDVARSNKLPAGVVQPGCVRCIPA